MIYNVACNYFVMLIKNIIHTMTQSYKTVDASTSIYLSTITEIAHINHYSQVYITYPPDLQDESLHSNHVIKVGIFNLHKGMILPA